MKSLSILVFITIWQCCDTHSFPIFESMSGKVHELTKKLVVSLKWLRNRIKTFIFSNVESDTHPINLNLDTTKYQRTKKEFNKRVEEEETEQNKDSPIYLNLRSEPTALMSTPQLATSHGKRIESHVVLTKDGYLITLHNLKRSFENNVSINDILPSCTVLLHHGLLGSSADWILLGPEKSLPYLLTNRNCDVWLTNARGNHYSRGHIWKKINSKEFWNFSWTEMGLFDLPSVVDYIRKVKNSAEPINFIGHSMGATAFLAMLSTVPNYNEYFRMAILFSPLVFMVNVDSPLRELVSVANNPSQYLLSLLGEGEFIPSRKIPSWITNKYCKGPEIFCANLLLFITASIPDENIWDESLIARILSHVPAGGSTNTLLHYAQMMRSGKFHKFNDDSEEFLLKKVKVPIVLFSSSEDLLAPVSDVLRLFFNLPCPIDHYMIRDKGFSHMDFIWSPEAQTLVFDKVIEFLSNAATCYNISLNKVE